VSEKSIGQVDTVALIEHVRERCLSRGEDFMSGRRLEGVSS